MHTSWNGYMYLLNYQNPFSAKHGLHIPVRFLGIQLSLLFLAGVLLKHTLYGKQFVCLLDSALILLYKQKSMFFLYKYITKLNKKLNPQYLQFKQFTWIYQVKELRIHNQGPGVELIYQHLFCPKK